MQAYIQQLESGKLKLAQLEQDLQRARSQVLFKCTFFFPIFQARFMCYKFDLNL
jgi:hypothetical protein